MSPSMSDALNGLLIEQYKQCWNYLPLSGGQKYVARIRVSYQPDGSLTGQPVLTNPPSDPAFRGLAESALRAVRRCNPLRIPPQFQPYYEQWKDWVIGFDPEILN
jgi:colicin import membrane protein